MNDLISRKALIAEYDRVHIGPPGGARKLMEDAPTVDAVVMPKGKPGDFLEWNNGCGFTQIYYIHAVSVYEDCMRYELEKFAPVVNHPCIVRIMSKEEARKEWLERRKRERAEEEQTLTAKRMDGDGNE